MKIVIVLLTCLLLISCATTNCNHKPNSKKYVMKRWGRN